MQVAAIPPDETERLADLRALAILDTPQNRRSVHLMSAYHEAGKAYADMGILGFADVDALALGEEDERVAEAFDRERLAQS